MEDTSVTTPCAPSRARGGAALGDPVAARGLAVGPGNAHGPEVLRGTAIQFVRDIAGLFAQSFDRNVRHLPRRTPLESGSLPQDRGGAALERLSDVPAAVVAFARIGEEHVSRHYPAAVRGGRCRPHT